MVDREAPEEQAVCWRCRLDYESEALEHGVTLATAELWTISPDVSDPVVALDAVSQDLANFVIFYGDDGYLHPDLEIEALSEGMVVADRVLVEPRYRGYGLGPLLLAEALSILGVGYGIAVCEPAPFELAADPAVRAPELRRLRALWSRFGFQEWKQGLYYLDLSSMGLIETRDELHKRFA